MKTKEYKHFRPHRMASWWCTLEDILWPEKKIIDKIKRRAEGFANAKIDTAINFGFHARFDFANYFGQLHGYYANVCEELHKYGIKFMDHYSCNIVERPKDEKEFRKLHSSHRHHILLHHDPIAAAYAQYEGYRFHDICEVDVRDGSRGYSLAYQSELFCHNNPKFLDMNRKYLERLLAEVPLDGIEVDDMCDYGGLATCGCKYCLDRFRRDYGHELPPFDDKDFWGDTTGHPTTWGNYNNHVFRDWIRMRSDSVADHVKIIKEVVGDIPLMTCCSSTGPIALNAISLDLEKMMKHLDLVMLENCGMNVNTVNWYRMEAEALQQKDIAKKMGNAPAIALSYTVYDIGGYLGWCLSRFWGVGNWSSTLPGRFPVDPADGKEIHEIIGPINNWEEKYSDLHPADGHDVIEVRLASNRYCRENGWRDEQGFEHWNKVSAWSVELLKNNIGYRFVRAEELSDSEALKSEKIPLILDSLACISDDQYSAITDYLAAGGIVWLNLPFGTHDEKGFERKKPLSVNLLEKDYPGLIVIDSGAGTGYLSKLLDSGVIKPRIKQISGDTGWAARLRVHSRDGVVLHLMNRALDAMPHPTLKDLSGVPVLLDVNTANTDSRVEYLIDFTDIGEIWKSAIVLSPELGADNRPVKVEKISDTLIRVSVDISGVKVYGVVQALEA